MDVRFPSSALKAAAEAAAAAARPDRAGPAGGIKPVGPAASGPDGGFSTVLTGALQRIDAAQNEASKLQTAFDSGAPGASLEQTMVSMQKAQIGFQAAVTVRNRLVSAYTDIMNMQV
ncbi:MAG: flagellar hook-basal body complex protein FliE [Lautropia sp.]